uniref:Uncharacterized protein n=1 Tax=Schistosoma japonicum TaxID=6182 RepID=C1LNA5_SCHJA|nr:hypothetical protein [Schistosoma japonicum]
MMSIILCLIILSYIISFALMELIVEPLVVWKYGKNRNDGYVVVTDVNNHNHNDNDDDDADADVTVMNRDNFIGNDVCVNKFDDIRDDKINVDEAGCGENEENIDNEGENDEVRDNDGDDGNEYGDVAIDIDEDVAINTYCDFIDNNADTGTVVVDTVAVAAGDGFDSHVDIVSSNGDVVIDIDKSVDACSDYDATAAASAVVASAAVAFAAVAAHYDDVDYDGNVSKKFRWKVFRYFCCC